MKTLKKLSKRTRIISLMILLVLVSATTIAFLQDYTGTITNTFSLRSIDTDIEEKVDTDLSKVPFVVNKDVTDVMVRVRIVISGDFSDFALAGIDTHYKNAGNEWEGSTPAHYSNDVKNNEYWSLASSEHDINGNAIEYVYYYKYVLYGTSHEDKSHVTQPVFDKILLKGDDNNFIEYNGDNAEQFAALENVQITIYQESVPLTVVNGDNVLKANYNATDGSIVLDDDGTKAIWNYFDNEKTTS